MRHSLHLWMVIGAVVGGSTFGQELSVEVTGSGTPIGGCHAPGATVTVAIHVGPYRPAIAGGQFFLQYDPACLTSPAVLPGAACDPESPFDHLVFEAIDEAAGAVFAAVDTGIIGNGTTLGAAMVCLTFEKTADCAACQMCLDSVNPFNTALIDINAMPVEPIFVNGGCSPLVRGLGESLLSCPASVSKNADCESSSATVSWTPPIAQDSCDGDIIPSCTAVHDGGQNVGGLIMQGGAFPIGTTTIVCTATNSCGVVEECGWSVTIHEETTIDLIVQLSPTIAPNVLQRCIEFTLYPDCVLQPIQLTMPLTFNLPGMGQGVAHVSLNVPAGQYACVTARDPLHTLMAVAMPQCLEDGRFRVEFSGDPDMGGNWLIGGNLNRSRIIDILDFGVLVSRYLTLADPNTTCAQVANLNFRHADINGDGVVDIVELSFIMINFIETDKDACCGPLPGVEQPVTNISVADAIANGWGFMAGADLNGDGWVNVADVQAMQNGAVPPARKHNIGFSVSNPALD